MPLCPERHNIPQISAQRPSSYNLHTASNCPQTFCEQRYTTRASNALVFSIRLLSHRLQYIQGLCKPFFLQQPCKASSQPLHATIPIRLAWTRNRTHQHCLSSRLYGTPVGLDDSFCDRCLIGRAVEFTMRAGYASSCQGQNEM